MIPTHLERLVDEHRILLVEIIEQQKALREEHEALSDSIHAAGLLKPGVLQYSQKLRRAAAMAQQFFNFTDLVIAMGEAAGLRATRSMALASKCHNKALRQALPRLTRSVNRDICVFGGRAAGVELSLAEQLNLSSGSWEPLIPMPTARDGCAAAGCGGCIYVFGGYGSNRVLATVERFDTTKATWDVVAKMPTARLDAAAAAHGGLLYVAGGQAGRQVLNIVESFDPELGTWSDCMAMPTSRRGCCAASAFGMFLVCGGVGTSSSVLAMTEAFDTRTGWWKEFPPMNKARAGCAAATLGGATVYVVGGFADNAALSTVERYDNCAGWEYLAPMSVPRRNCAAVAAKGAIYVFGGYGSDALASCERLQQPGSTWEPAPFMATARGAACAAAVWR